MNNENFIGAQLALLAWREGSAHGLQSLLAIAHMIVNRHKAGWGTLLDCIKNYQTFSARNVEPELEPAFPDLAEPGFRKLLQQIDDIAAGTAADTYTVAPADPATGAPDKKGLYCAELNRVDREYFLTNICRRPDEHPRVATVAGLTFFA